MGVAIQIPLGQRFGQWVVVREAEPLRKGKRAFLCRCDCGREKVVDFWNLYCGKSTSCGHNQGKRGCPRAYKRTHGCSRTPEGRSTPEYIAWAGMKQRCLNPNHKAYKRYGGSGISICKRWEMSFQAFLDDMGTKPGSSYSLDRIDGKKGYEPGNVRWATLSEQHRNQCNTRPITANGVTKLLCEWSDETGLSADVIAGRIRNGWRVEDAVSQPLRTRIRT